MKYLLSLIVIAFLVESVSAQWNCTFKEPVVKIGFGSGMAHDVNITELYNYERVYHYCPPDGYYSYASSTSDCFRGDWHTLAEDHTAGDVGGNMLLVNGAPEPGIFLKTTIAGLKASTTYEFGMWLMNLCKPSDKCPFPLLPNIVVRLETTEGKMVAQFSSGELTRDMTPNWRMYRAIFITPPGMTYLNLVMADSAPGGCGNDFALDDITFRECMKIIPPPKTTAPAAKIVVPVAKKATASNKPASKPPPKEIAIKQSKVSQVVKSTDTIARPINIIKEKRNIVSTVPLVLTTRENALVKRIETDAGEIKIELYDNGEIDGDTVSIYHNNVLIKSHARLSEKPISFSIKMDPEQPHHELIMVAENLGSIPPNTSVMIVYAGANRYQVFISSTEQKNAKVILDLKK